MQSIVTVALAAVLAQSPAAPALESAWREQLVQYATAHLEHPAWGVAHARRNYRLTLELARAAKTEVDEEAIFAAAYLHDIGAIEPFRKPGVEHMARALELIDPILAGAGFPMEKAPLVHTIVAHHMYFSDPANLPPSALFFRDADTLDFLGAVGVSRLFALTGKHSWATDIDTAEATIRRNAAELPAKLVTAPARALGATRVAEMQTFLAALEKER
jgi:uncharacterized protein